MTSLLLLKSMLVASALSKTKKKRSTSKKKEAPLVKPKPVRTLQSSMNICRICNEEDGVVPIFNNLVNPNITEDIYKFSGIRIENCPGLSNHMCQNCMGLLQGCIMFREMCQKSNERFQEVAIKKEISMDSEDYEYEKQDESDHSFNIPSPSFSEECTAAIDPPNIKYEPKTNEKKQKSFLCDVCGKTAKSNANLLMHKSIHEQTFPYKCDKCPYRGRSYGLLKVHLASHLSESELPYRCTQCPKATTTASNLSKHIKNVHSCDNKNRYKCTYCERAFSFQHDMKRHVKEIHLRQGTVECNVCFKKFNTRKILRGHQFKIHKMKGARQGRLPAYLQAKNIQDPIEDSIEETNEPIANI